MAAKKQAVKKVAKVAKVVAPLAKPSNHVVVDEKLDRNPEPVVETSVNPKVFMDDASMDHGHDMMKVMEYAALGRKITELQKDKRNGYMIMINKNHVMIERLGKDKTFTTFQATLADCFDVMDKTAIEPK